MISVELWRARIGTFNNKRCSGCRLSSSSLSGSSHCHRQTHHGGGGSTDASREPTKEQSQEFSSTDHHSECISSSTCAPQSRSQLTLCCSYGSSFSSTSKSSSSSSPSPCDLHRSLLRDAVIALLIAVISQLLMIAGDIETNPGPKHGADDKPGLNDLLFMSYTGKDGIDTHFRLMDQLQPHWRRLAIALKFRQCDIAVMEQKDDPVYHLLSEWLRGANQERDSRPVTWATLITALREANVQEEANILEKHFVKIRLPAVPVTMSQAEGSQVPGKYFELIRHPSGGYIMRHGPIRVFVKPSVPEKLRSLLDEYASMLMILRRSKLSEANFSDLKLYLSGYCSLESIEQCTSLRAVVDLLIKHLKMYMFNIYTLNDSCKYFNDTIKDTVQKYKKCLDNFLKDTSIEEFRNNMETEVVDRIGMDSITLKLHESRVDDTLKALNTLLYHFFGNCSRALSQCEIGSGCVCITWLVSSSLVSTLRTMIERHTQESLASQGVLELVIVGLRIAPIGGQVSIITGGTPSTDDLEHEWSKERLSFKKHRLELSKCIQYPTLLYCRLQSAGLLPRDVSMKISYIASTKLGVSELLDAIEAMVNLNSENFYKFIDVLEKDITMWPICNKLCSTALQVIPPTSYSSYSYYSSTTSSSPSSSLYVFSPSSIAVAMKQYRAYLKDRYLQPFPDYDQLLTTTTKHYIEQAVVRREYKGANKQFNLAEILIPITLKEILKYECRPGRRILIEGRPSIGKSTLAWELCHKWEELDSAKQYELVVLARLREKKAQEARCLEDLLPCDATTNIKKLIAAFGRGKGVLIVCDGFDELPDEQRQEGSVYMDLIKGQLLPEATIIVTSRPSVSASLWRLCQHNIDRHLEVIGFTTAGIKQFAESVFSGDILEGFLSYITSNPPIYSMMYIPLNAVIVALIYQDSYNTDTPFPTTMTQLFDALTRALICKHLKLSCKFLCEFRMPFSLQRMKDINMLPSLISQQMVKLAKMAHEGMLNETYIFTDLNEDFEGLGIMKKIANTGCGCSYTFLYPTLQEYMAALYSAINQTSELYYSDRIIKSDVMRFVAGICSHGEYRDQRFYRSLVGLISETSPNSNSLLLVQCAYECPSIMHDVMMECSNDCVIHVEPVLNFDWYVTGYCISHFNLKWGLGIHQVIEENTLDLLVQGIRSSPVTVGSIQEMKISCMPTSLSKSQIFDKLKEFCQLQSLELVISDDALWRLELAIAFDDTEDIKDAIEGLESAGSSGPTEDDALVMRQLIEPGSSLKSLKFWGSPNLIPILLAQSSLEELTIKNHYYAMPDLLPQKNTNLKELVITSCRLLVSLAKLLPNYTSLTCLIINGSVCKDELSVLTELIQSHPTLEVLGIGDYRYGKSGTANLLQLVETAASSQLKQLLFSPRDYKLIPLHIQEQYKHVLGELPQFREL